MYSVRLLSLLACFAGLALAMAPSAAQDAKGEWVTIKGQVVMPNPPEARKIDVTTDKDHCLKDGPQVSTEIVVNPKSKGVKNVVVWLRPDTKDRKDPFPADKVKPELAKAAPKTIVVDQPCCQFIPRVFAARTGDKLVVKNSAPVPHNINYSSDIESFNVTIQPGKEYAAQQPLAAQSTPIPFKCDIHPWMAGRGRVFDHPYFAVTDDDGKFEIKDTPAGKWRIVYWHEGGFHKGREGVLGFEVEAKGPTLELKPIDLELPK